MLDTRDIKILLDSIESGVILLNEDYEVLHANNLAIDFFGDRILGNQIYSFIRHQDLIDFISQGTERNITFQYASNNLAKQIVDISVICLESNQKLLIVDDRSKEEAFENVRREFVANVSHELRSPLTTIIGFIETLKSGEVEKSKSAQFLNIIEEESNRMARLLEDLLSLSKLEINMHQKPDRLIDVRGPLLTVKNALEIAAKKNEISISLKDTASITAILGDSDEITQVFYNLLDNAIKYSEPKSEIVMLLKDEVFIGESFVSISIINSGPGISEEHLPRLTERFYRVDKGRSRKVGGTGLGLAIVKHILTRHSGQLSIESLPDKVTTFKVLLPSSNGNESAK